MIFIFLNEETLTDCKHLFSKIIPASLNNILKTTLYFSKYACNRCCQYSLKSNSFLPNFIIVSLVAFCLVTFLNISFKMPFLTSLYKFSFYLINLSSVRIFIQNSLFLYVLHSLHMKWKSFLEFFFLNIER